MTFAPWDDRIRRRLKLRDVDVLLAVVQTGSMGKAGAVLRMSQPAVSKAIASLEQTLGVQLLDAASSRRPTALLSSNAAWPCSTSCDRASRTSRFSRILQLARYVSEAPTG